FFGKRKSAELFARDKFRQPLLFLFVSSKKQQGANPDGMVRVHEHGCGCASATDFLEHFAVRHLNEPPSVVLCRRGHPEHADAPKTINDLARNLCLSIYLGWIEIEDRKSTRLNSSHV